MIWDICRPVTQTCRCRVRHPNFCLVFFQKCLWMRACLLGVSVTLRQHRKSDKPWTRRTRLSLCFAFSEDVTTRRAERMTESEVQLHGISVAQSSCHDKVSHYLPTQTHTRWPPEYVLGSWSRSREDIHGLFTSECVFGLFRCCKTAVCFRSRRKRFTASQLNNIAVILVLRFIIRAAPAYLDPSLWVSVWMISVSRAALSQEGVKASWQRNKINSGFL